MSKFNQKAVAAAVQEYKEVYGNTAPEVAVKRTTNQAGGPAFELSPQLALYSRVCTMGLSDKYYESESTQMQKLFELMDKNDPVFIAKLAIYAREKMYLRTIPLVLAVELVKRYSGDNLVSQLLKRVIKRADEITETLAYYQVANHRQGQTKKLNKLANQVKQGIRGVFESGRFDEYQYGKYNRDGEVKLRDALFLTHPKPQDKSQKDLFDKIVNGTLEVPYTWETQLSDAGQTGRSKKEVWEELIMSDRLGYMALLRNIRNFLKEDVSYDHINKVCDTIADRDMVLKSKQLPFRFLSAYRSLVAPYQRWGSNPLPEFIRNSPYAGRLVEALEMAISYSVDNLPMFKGENVLVASDVSGSMMSPISPRSSINQFDIGALLCMIARAACENSVAGMFGNDFKTLDVGKSNILGNVNELYRREGEVGYSTHGYKVIQYANKNPVFDRIMIFTDCQLYNDTGYQRDSHIDEYWQKYRHKNLNAKLYLFDLAGYGNVPVRMLDNNVYLIAGWSDKVFDILKRIEMGQSAIDEINSIDFDYIR